MYNVFVSESTVLRELDLFYHFIMWFDLLNPTFGKYEFLSNRFYGFAQNIFKTDWFSFFQVYFYLLYNHKYKYVGDNCRHH